MQLAKIRPEPLCQSTAQCVVFATNAVYAPYLGVALYSLKKHALKGAVYDIFILHTELADDCLQRLQSLQAENFSIRFVNVSSYLDAIDADIFVTHAHFSREAYYRFFIPLIFQHYTRVLYCDCDMLFLRDVSDLFSIDLLQKPLAAVLEYKFKCKVEYDAVLKDYASTVLQLENAQNYFNSGLLVFDIPKLLQLQFTQKCLEKLCEVQRPRTVDQCIINSVMQNNVSFLEPCWNMQTHVILEELKMHVSQNDYESYAAALESPYIVHFCSPIKPWNDKNIPFASLWWHYAKKSPFFA